MLDGQANDRDEERRRARLLASVKQTTGGRELIRMMEEQKRNHEILLYQETDPERSATVSRRMGHVAEISYWLAQLEAELIEGARGG